MSHSIFKGFSSITNPLLGEQLSNNMQEWLDWNFVNTGGYVNISLSESGTYGGDKSRLRPVRDRRYDNGQVWEGYRSNWVWQSGINQDDQPTQVSGVYVDGTFYTPSDATYGHHVNYPLGRIVFNSNIPTTSTVQCEHSPKFVKVVDVDDVPFFKNVQLKSWRVDLDFLKTSGNWSVLGDTRVQLPLVGVDVQGRTYSPYAIGGGQWAESDITFHIVGEDQWSVGQIADAISYQNDRNIYLYDVNRMKNDDISILDINGSITADTKTYPALVAESGNGGYRYKKCYLDDTEALNGRWVTPHIYMQEVNFTTEVILGNI
jgi:hypothetical protein